MNESKKQSIMAFARLACALLSAGAALFGVAVDADALFVGVVVVIALFFYIWSWWKNNNVTEAASEAQDVLDFIKRNEAYALDPEDIDADEEVLPGDEALEEV